MVCAHRWMISWMRTKKVMLTAMPIERARSRMEKRLYRKHEHWQVLLFCQSKQNSGKRHQNDWHWIIALIFHFSCQGFSFACVSSLFHSHPIFFGRFSAFFSFVHSFVRFCLETVQFFICWHLRESELLCQNVMCGKATMLVF